MLIEEIKEKVIDMKQRYGSWTQADKAMLRMLVKELSIEHKFKGNCSNCYNDAFHLVVNKLCMTSADFAHKSSNGVKYKFVGAREAVWHGPYGTVVLNEFTPDDMVENFISSCGSQDYFVLNN